MKNQKQETTRLHSEVTKLQQDVVEIRTNQVDNLPSSSKGNLGIVGKDGLCVFLCIDWERSDNTIVAENGGNESWCGEIEGRSLLLFHFVNVPGKMLGGSGNTRVHGFCC